MRVTELEIEADALVALLLEEAREETARLEAELAREDAETESLRLLEGRMPAMYDSVKPHE